MLAEVLYTEWQIALLKSPRFERESIKSVKELINDCIPNSKLLPLSLPRLCLLYHFKPQTHIHPTPTFENLIKI